MAWLVLDTCVLIDAVGWRLDLSRLADDVELPAMSVGEYLAGVLLDGDPG